jgi:hypothetical protein
MRKTLISLGGLGVAALLVLTACGGGNSNSGTAGPPANPGNTKNCADFATWQEANTWFQAYYPYYGDVAHLDADHDGIPCESLRGHP